MTDRDSPADGVTRRRALRLGTAAAGTLVTGIAPAAADVDPLENEWLGRRVLDFAHQGGALEAPSDTLFSLETAKAKGADVLEIDVHATADGEVVAIHDTTVDRTTNGSGRVDEHTLAELKELDAAHWFVEDCGACRDHPPGRYPYRGYATGDTEIPPGVGERYGLDGFEPNDFTIPTLREILERFPDTLINIEIKNTAPDTEPYEREVARLLQEYGREDDVLVVSFLDHALEKFKAHAPEVDTALATGQAAAFHTSARMAAPGAPNPRYEALQVPISFSGIQVVDEDFVRDAHANDLAVHVWTIDDRETMRWLLDIGVDGIMTDRPTLLEDVLAETDVERYEG